MVLGNVLYMLFALPLILFSLYYWFSVASLAQDEAIQQVFTGQENLLLSYLLICVPLYAITGPAKAGLYYCLRNWVWNERATIREHFLERIPAQLLESTAVEFVQRYAAFCRCVVDCYADDERRGAWMDALCGHCNRNCYGGVFYVLYLSFPAIGNVSADVPADFKKLLYLSCGTVPAYFAGSIDLYFNGCYMLFFGPDFAGGDFIYGNVLCLFGADGF